MSVSDNKYKMSFTTGGLFYNESLLIAETQKNVGDWQKTRDKVLADNLLQTRTISSAMRRVREICARLKLLSADQLLLLLSGTRQEQQCLLWVAVCKRYRFIAEFATEIVREKYLRIDLDLQFPDYDIFFDNKAEWHQELEQLKDSTRTKLRQVLFKIMREAEIISTNNMIIPGLLTEQFTKVIVADTPSLLSTLPVSDMDINSCLN